MAEAEPPPELFVFLIQDETMKNIQYLCQFTCNWCHKPPLAPVQNNWHSMGRDDNWRISKVCSYNCVMNLFYFVNIFIKYRALGFE
jgi:hypothetical protein